MRRAALSVWIPTTSKPFTRCAMPLRIDMWLAPRRRRVLAQNRGRFAADTTREHVSSRIALTGTCAMFVGELIGPSTAIRPVASVTTREKAIVAGSRVAFVEAAIGSARPCRAAGVRSNCVGRVDLWTSVSVAAACWLFVGVSFSLLLSLRLCSCAWLARVCWLIVFLAYLLFFSFLSFARRLRLLAGLPGFRVFLLSFRTFPLPRRAGLGVVWLCFFVCRARAPSLAGVQRFGGSLSLHGGPLCAPSLRAKWPSVASASGDGDYARSARSLGFLANASSGSFVRQIRLQGFSRGFSHWVRVGQPVARDRAQFTLGDGSRRRRRRLHLRRSSRPTHAAVGCIAVRVSGTRQPIWCSAEAAPTGSVASHRRFVSSGGSQR